MSGGLAFVVRILGHEAYPVLFPSMLSIFPSLDVRRSHRRESLEMIVFPFLLLRPFRRENCTKRRHNLFFARVLLEPKTNFAMMPEERIIPLN